MARTLKLDCITISVTEKDDDKACYFDEFFRYNFNGKIISRPFRDFFTAYVESFSGKFLAAAGVSKAMRLVPNSIHWNSARRIISGIVKGGNIGSTVDVESSEEATDVPLFIIKPEHVASEPFHFLLWMPKDFQKGLLLVQGYTNATITDAFKQTLTAFFRVQCPFFALRMGLYVDKESIDKFLRDSRISHVTFRRTRIISDLTESDLSETEGKIKTEKERKINVDVKVTGLASLEGFGDRFSRWTKGEVPALFEMDDMQSMGVEGEYQTIVGYINPEGHRASAKSKTEFQIQPVIYVDPTRVICETDGRPDSGKMQVYLLEELARMQKELGYTDATKS